MPTLDFSRKLARHSGGCHNAVPNFGRAPILTPIRYQIFRLLIRIFGPMRPLGWRAAARRTGSDTLRTRFRQARSGYGHYGHYGQPGHAPLN